MPKETHDAGLLASWSISGLGPLLGLLSSCPPVMGLALQAGHALGPNKSVTVAFPGSFLIKLLPHPVFVRVGLDSGSQLGHSPFLLFPLS